MGAGGQWGGVEFWGDFGGILIKWAGCLAGGQGRLGVGGWVQEGAGPPGGSPGNAEAFPGLWGVRPIKSRIKNQGGRDNAFFPPGFLSGFLPGSLL